MRTTKTVYQVRKQSKAGSDHVSLHSVKREAQREAKRLSKSTGVKHHVLTLNDSDGLGELRGMMAL